MTEIKSVFMEKNGIDYRDEAKSTAFLEFSYSYDSDARIKIEDFIIECSSTSMKPSSETLTEELNAVLSEKLELESREKSKLLAFLEFPDGQELDIWMKMNGF